jgi:hypothetical protein
MIRHHRLEHRFVTSIPRQLEPGVLYISIECATAIHGEVVTPLAPTDWQLTFDGETVSLWPSIGNWNFPCRSHYVIERSEVIQALPWSDRRIAQGRFRDRLAKSRYYDAGEELKPPPVADGDGVPPAPAGD